MLIRDVEVDWRRVDVRVTAGAIAEIAPGLPGPAELDGHGAALLPGLHDHHLHLLATAAHADSLRVGPPHVTTPHQLAAALHVRPLAGWLRCVDYHESVAGLLDRAALDDLRADVPIRVQHSSGALWMLNTAALRELGMTDDAHLPPSVERDARGRVTGRVWRGDAWLGRRVRSRARARVEPDLRDVGARLAAFGVTGVTDATPHLDDASLATILRARADGSLPQRVTLLADVPAAAAGDCVLGPGKIVVADHDLPALAELVRRVRAVHDSGRPVAVHCVTSAALMLTVAALDEAGAVDGDRVEHAAVAAPQSVARLADLGVRVVTQPSLPARRGDEYLAGTDESERDQLWPFGSLLRAGVRVGCSSDAPYGDLDPWAAIRAATERRTPSGRDIGPWERVSAQEALRGYLGRPDDPGGPPRRVRVGAAADLVLLDAPLATVLADPNARRVRTTVQAGRVVHDAERHDHEESQ
ncbi:amidohydrolase family protein [Jatrophihabitans endophyticus]|uniref:amidohydrolase family protein n=1 Tax=Jatrophihabitans endophyticus TaxID=1206085 RepID=UPI000932980E|nr:amidohydrolase family protein [Jatrophihabitans endophyticus]